MSVPEGKGWCGTSFELLEYWEGRLLRHLNMPYRKLKVDMLNTLEIVQRDKDQTPIVVIHGFASGLATFVNIFNSLGERYGRVYGIDLFGFGMSCEFPSYGARHAEDLFVMSLERWRVAMKLERMIILAHSFGAYISTSYADIYPERVERLVLFEPWGLQTVPKSYFPSLNPLWYLRMAGPVGLFLMRVLTLDLFKKFSTIGEGDEMLNYLYHCNVQCTADEAFMALTGPSYIAKRPIIPPAYAKIIQGSESWIERIESAEVVPNAGHQLYAEQPELFMEAVFRAIDD